MKKGWGCTTGGRHRWKEWLALYERLRDNDHTSHKYSIMVVKEGNDNTVDLTVNDSRSEQQGGRIEASMEASSSTLPRFPFSLAFTLQRENFCLLLLCSKRSFL